MMECVEIRHRLLVPVEFVVGSSRALKTFPPSLASICAGAYDPNIPKYNSHLKYIKALSVCKERINAIAYEAYRRISFGNVIIACNFVSEIDSIGDKLAAYGVSPANIAKFSTRTSTKDRIKTLERLNEPNTIMLMTQSFLKHGGFHFGLVNCVINTNHLPMYNAFAKLAYGKGSIVQIVDKRFECKVFGEYAKLIKTDNLAFKPVPNNVMETAKKLDYYLNPRDQVLLQK